MDLPFDPPRRDRMSFFHVPIDERDVAAMVLGEGAAMRLFTAAALAALAEGRALGPRRRADARTPGDTLRPAPRSAVIKPYAAHR